MLCPVKVRRGGNTGRLELATGFVPLMSSNSMFRSLAKLEWRPGVIAQVLEIVSDLLE
jgi:hypothetical protein